MTISKYMGLDENGNGTIPGNLQVNGQTNYGTDGGGVWRDLVMPLIPPNAGGTIPTVTQIGTSGISMPLWQINDQMWVAWHMQHDYALSTPVYFHVHWLVDGVSTNTVKWEFNYYHAKGHNQAAFPLGGAGTIITAEQAASGTAFKHMITETSGVTITALEPDSVILARIRRITNGGTDNPNNVFGFMTDLHYQANTPGTKNRSPNFYT